MDSLVSEVKVDDETISTNDSHSKRACANNSEVTSLANENVTIPKMQHSEPNSTFNTATTTTTTSVQCSPKLISVLRISSFSISSDGGDKQYEDSDSYKSYDSLYDDNYQNNRMTGDSIIDDESLANSFTKVLTLRSTDQRGPFIEALHDHLRKILILIEINCSPSWCLDYLRPLLQPVEDLSLSSLPNYIQCFDETCGLLNRIAGLTDLNTKVLEYLYSVTEYLLEISKQTNIYGQISYETILCLMAESVDSRKSLQQVVQSRTLCFEKNFYDSTLIRFRAWRADLLKVLFGKAVRTDANYSRLIRGCIDELRISYSNEPSPIVRSRYNQVFEEFGRSFPSINKDFEDRNSIHKVSKISKVKWENAKRSIGIVLGEA